MWAPPDREGAKIGRACRTPSSISDVARAVGVRHDQGALDPDRLLELVETEDFDVARVRRVGGRGRAGQERKGEEQDIHGEAGS